MIWVGQNSISGTVFNFRTVNKLMIFEGLCFHSLTHKSVHFLSSVSARVFLSASLLLFLFYFQVFLILKSYFACKSPVFPLFSCISCVSPVCPVFVCV